jgi:hypothetical protein
MSFPFHIYSLEPEIAGRVFWAALLRGQHVKEW